MQISFNFLDDDQHTLDADVVLEIIDDATEDIEDLTEDLRLSVLDPVKFNGYLEELDALANNFRSTIEYARTRLGITV